MDRFSLVLLYTVLAYVDSQIISKLDHNVSISCRCSVNYDCRFPWWAKVTMNGSLENVKTESGRYFSQSRSHYSGVAELNIFQTEMVDAGRYYCGVWQAGYFKFIGEGTSLLVEEKVWTNRSQVMLLIESAVPERPLRSSAPLQAELRCVVAGVRSPGVTIVWRSSRGAQRTGHTAAWESEGSESVFSVTSKLQINYTSQDAPEVLEEWWCEVQVGVHLVERSNITSLHLLRVRDHLEASPVDWCRVLVYSAGALSAVCVCVISVLITHWMLHLPTSAGIHTPLSVVSSTGTTEL